jgi:8-amino-7-oxononanoate synthase
VDEKADFLLKKLNQRKQEGLFRELKPPQPLIDFSSNDYLGFARSEVFSERIKDSLTTNGSAARHGSTGSRLLTGNTLLAEELETEIARFHAAESGLLFNSGYDANLGLFSSLAGRNDTILYDELIHASIKDGARLSLALHFSFRHNDLNHLEQKIKSAKGRIFVAVESVYSMDGDSAPLTELVALAGQYPDVHLIVDEAHATGVFGEKGCGLVQELKLEDKFFARVHTFGKALGCHGAIVLGSNALRSYLINFARSFIYTTALPHPSLTAIREAYRMLREENEKIMQLRKLIGFFRLQAEAYPSMKFIDSRSAIQSLVVPGNEAARSIAHALQEKGFDLRPILSPTVPKGKERLRICLHTFNTGSQIQKLLKTIATCLEEEYL